MKILYVSILAAAVSLTACNGGENKAAQSGANTSVNTTTVAEGVLSKIEWIDTEKNLGTINEGQKSEVVFRFKNVGDKPLIVKNVVAQCGCTAPEPSKEPVMPGKEGFVKAVFDSQGRAGENSKQLTVHTNTDPESSIVTFKVYVKANGADANGALPQAQPQPQGGSVEPGHEGHNH